MGFYGNITNTSRTSFQFDRIYANRYEMDLSCGSDGIYIGRYVLVNYEDGTSFDVYNNTYYCYEKDGIPTFYSSLVTCEERDKLDENNELPVVSPGGNNNSYQSGATAPNDPSAETARNYIAPAEKTLVTAADVVDGQIVRVEKNRHLYSINPEPFFIRVTEAKNLLNVSFTASNESEYREHWGLTDDQAVDVYEHHVHIINNVVRFNNSKEASVGAVFTVPSGGSYQTNAIETELWTAHVNGVNLVWTQLSSEQSEYLKNFNIDKAFYGVSRGYDSTVWQKTYTNGVEAYVMIAELNTVVPTFDVCADAPSIVPISPHFDSASTNVYYKFHWQPQWGFRIKGASNALVGQEISQLGEITGLPAVTLRQKDKVFYPSDETVKWTTAIYNVTNDLKENKYYNVKTGQWNGVQTGVNNDVPAAIYFNKRGFSPTAISYSLDIINNENRNYDKTIAESGWVNDDTISITPTGFSGNVYNAHNGSTNYTPQEDTQELSVMLPSLGDTIAKIWDLTYGGRDTNNEIATSNLRNLDIEWENASGNLDRHGLRLVGDKSGSAYNKAEVNTIAGCINTAHDLMGMIITPIAIQEDANKLQLQTTNPDGSVSWLQVPLSDFDDNRIYFDTVEEKYYRKHTKYNYDESKVTGQFIAAEDLIPENFTEGLYYKEENGEKVPATEYEPGTQYFVKELTSDDIYTEIKGDFDTFDGSRYLYQDYSGSPKASTDLMKDYISDAKYQPNRKYYEVTPSQEYRLSGKYEKDKYFYILNGSYILDRNDEAYRDEHFKYIKRNYFVIDDSKVKEIKDYNYDGVYVPNAYYYYWPAFDKNGEEIVGGGEYVLDTNFPALTAYPQVYETDFTPDAYINKYAGQKPAHFGISPKKKDSNGISYVLQRTYKPIGTLPFNKYTPGVYYCESNTEEGVYELSFVWKESERYFIREESYKVLTGDQLSIDPNPLALVNFTENTFYNKIESETEKGKIVEYRLYSMNDIVELMKQVASGDVDEDKYKEYKFYSFGARLNLTYDFVDADGNPYNDACQSNLSFYEPDKYHYLVETGDHTGSYILDTRPQITNGRKYFLIDSIKEVVGKTFYEPYKYYTESGDDYAISKTEEPTPGKTYYKRDAIYVKEDEANIYTPGAVWNAEAKNVPNTVTLAKRTEDYELIVLPEFARNVNTMNGLILKINKLLESEDTYTRQENTVQGTLNYINDILARFGKMASDNFLIVDDYGRVHSAELATQQTDSLGTKTPKAATPTAADIANYRGGISADKYPMVDSVGEMEKQWITVHVNGDVSNPKITFHHNFQPVKDTTNTANVNGNGDTIQLYTPIVDDMGHVVGKNTKTVTLPYGFKTIKVTNDSTTVADAASSIAAAGQIADNTQDELTFAASNKWIKFDNSSEDTIKVGHEVHAFDAGAANTWYGLDANETVASLDADNKFEVPRLKFDEAGHITAAETHTVSLPENFTKITVSAASNGVADLVYAAGSIEADTLTDEMTITPSNKWVKMSVDANKDTLTVGHEVHTINTTTNGDNVTQNTFGGTVTVPDFAYDEAGHFTSRGSHTVKLPDLGLTNATSGNVVTGISYGFDTASSKGTFTETKANAGTLALGTYSSPEGGKNIGTDSTISGAISTLDSRIYTEEQARAQAITDEVTNRNTAITTAIEALDTVENFVAEAGQIVDTISETDGIISVTFREGNIEQDTKFLYSVQEVPGGDGDGTVEEETQYTVAELMTHTAEIERSAITTETQFEFEEDEDGEMQYKTILDLIEEIKNLKAEIELLKNPPEEEEEVTP